MSSPHGLRAAIYCRISRDRVGAGLGVERQEQDCRALAERLGWNVAGMYVDNDVSAYSGKARPQYQRLVEDIRDGKIDGVLAWHSDRLHRSPLELEGYIAACDTRGVPTHTVSAGPIDLSTPSGRLIARQLGAVARYESEHKAERIRRQKRQAAEAGKWLGGARHFGFEQDYSALREDEAAEIRKAAELILAGASSNSILRDWEQRGVHTPNGRRWDRAGFQNMITRPRMAGLISYKGEIIGKADDSTAILDEPTWRAVCARLGDPGRRTSPGNQIRYLGSGLFRCGVCDDGTTVVAGRSGRGHGRNEHVPAYRCRKKLHMIRCVEHVDGLVVDLVVGWLSRPEAAEVFAADRPDLAGLREEARQLRARLDEAAALFADKAIDGRQLASITRSVRAELDQVDGQIAAGASGWALGEIMLAADVEEAWEALDLGRKQAVVDALMTVTLDRGGRGRPPGWRPGQPYFDARTVRIEWRRPS